MSRVLLLEDNDALAQSTGRALEVYGHSVTRFRNVREARHAIPPVGFDVLLCDYDLPDGTGLDFLAAVEASCAVGLSGWTTILSSGIDRQGAVAESGLAIDHVVVKDSRGVRTILSILDAE